MDLLPVVTHPTLVLLHHHLLLNIWMNQACTKCKAAAARRITKRVIGHSMWASTPRID